MMSDKFLGLPRVPIRPRKPTNTFRNEFEKKMKNRNFDHREHFLAPGSLQSSKSIEKVRFPPEFKIYMLPKYL